MRAYGKLTQLIRVSRETHSLRDTIDSVAIALILTLLFKCFIMEAFVIPTSSMAPTLYGAHIRIACPRCGYQYEQNSSLNEQSRVVLREGKPQWELVNFSEAGQRGDLVDHTTVPTSTYRTCPNCGKEIPASILPEYLDTRNLPRPHDARGSEIPFAWANNGDRILVEKYAYMFSAPIRWDVVVFKEPMAGIDNYIKRLIGLPGESIEIVGGDIFVGNAAQPGVRTVVRKPRYIQESVWRLVYDQSMVPLSNDYDAAVEKPFVQPWHVVGNSQDWDFSRPVVRFTPKNSLPGSITFAPSSDSSNARSIYNTLGYNNDYHHGIRRGEYKSDPLSGQYRYVVPDLKLSFVWTPQDESSAGLELILGPPYFRYRALLRAGQPVTIKPGAGNTPDTAFETTGKPVPAYSANVSYRVEFTNVDHAVELRVNGLTMARHEIPWTAESAKQQTSISLEPRDLAVEIHLPGPATLANLRLARDNYYTVIDDRRPNSPGQATTGNPIQLRSGHGNDEFFVLGDNSTESLDARWWDRVHPSLHDLATPVGVVPQRFMIGKAFFVYWPAAYRLPEAAPIMRNTIRREWPLVPNFADVRFIH